MGNPKQKWTSKEEEALRAGVAKHGTGKWKNIQRDPEFNPCLFSRSNIDLKDKWRNMTVSAAKTKHNPDAPAATPTAVAVTATLATPLSNPQTPAAPSPVSTDLTLYDSLKTTEEGKTAPKNNAMIFEAITALNDPNGVDTNAIVNYIEQKQVLPQNFKRQLSSRLRRLVAQEKLEKVQNCYKIKKGSSFGTKTPNPKRKDAQQTKLQSPGFINSADTVEEAAVAAADRVAEAEDKSYVAADAVKELERASKMAEDTDAILQLAKEIFQKCSRGEIVMIA